MKEMSRECVLKLNYHFHMKDGLYTRSSPDGGYYGALPNDGIFVNPMRSAYTPSSSTDSSESFFLHDPQEVIYNRVKDIFESDASVRDEPLTKSNALTVQAEIHSSSSGAASGGSDEESQENMKRNNKTTTENKAPQTSNHDYEDIYLVREEAKTATKKFYGRSRSRTDSGSHSRSASTSSTRSHDVVLYNKSEIRFDKNSRYEVPRKNKNGKESPSRTIPPTETTYESVGPSENVYDRRNNSLSSNCNIKTLSPIDLPPLPPPLPPPLMKSHKNVVANTNRDSNDSLDFSHVDDDSVSLESDSGLEVVEEPTLRPSELVRGNNNRSMSIISGKFYKANKKKKRKSHEGSSSL